MNDSLFSATTPVESSAYNTTLYLRDYRGFSVLGCYEQYQFCNPTLNDVCTPLAGQHTIGQFPFANISLNDRQGATQQLIWKLNNQNSLQDILLSLGISALNADNYVFGGYGLLSAALPSNQWNVEVIDWHNGIIANLQQLIVSFASGPVYADNEQYLTLPNTTAAHALCEYIKIRNASYSSFSVLGVVVILVAGCLIVLINLLLAPVTNFIRGKVNPNNYSRKEWIHGDFLQLLRMAFEGSGLGTWEGREASVPVTANGETFMLPVQGDAQVGRYPTDSKTTKSNSYEGNTVHQNGQFGPELKQGKSSLSHLFLC